jgi:hypothetical protein
MLILYFVVLGIVAGRLGGGRLDALHGVRFRWWAMALAGLLFQGLLFSDILGPAAGSWLPALYVTSTLLVLAALLRNLALPGFPVIAVGAALNLVVILANGGLMPSSREARIALTGGTDLGERITNSILVNADTLLPWLGDVFVLPRPLPFANAFSIGDILIGAGAAIFLVRAMRPVVDAPPMRGTLQEA